MKKSYETIPPDELKAHIATVLTVPMTPQGRNYPTRIPCKFQGGNGQVKWFAAPYTVKKLIEVTCIKFVLTDHRDWLN